MMRAVSDSDPNPMSDLLSTFALGPAWARATGSGQSSQPKSDSKSKDRTPRGDDRGGENRRDGFRDRDGGRKPFQKGRGGKFDGRLAGPPRQQEPLPAEGVRVTLTPDAKAVHLIGKEIHQVARVYPLYDVAKILLEERGRCRAVFEAPEPHAPLIIGKLDESLFLTREEAVRHLWQSELRAQFIEEETIEVDPPTGNFQLVARCGISGEWLGPPNFHAYQVNLRRLHRERFSTTPFAFYSSMVRTERGEEAVNAWLETMKKKTRWRIKGDADEAWIDDRVEAERALGNRCFDHAFGETRYAEVLASIPVANLSPSLLVSMKLAGNHARNHPAILIPAVCRAVEAEHLPVFKRLGKLFTGPARPHPLPVNAVLAERPGIMVEWIRANKPAKLEGLWKAVLPEGGSAPPAEFAADLFWLLQQGHILLFTDDTLVVQDLRETTAADADGEPKPAKRKKKKSKKAKPTAELSDTPDTDAAHLTNEDSPVSEHATESSATELPAIESAVEASAPATASVDVTSSVIEPSAVADVVEVTEPSAAEGIASVAEAPAALEHVVPAVSEPAIASEASAAAVESTPLSSQSSSSASIDSQITKNSSPGVDESPGL